MLAVRSVALVYVNLTEGSIVTCHADASVLVHIVVAEGIVLASVRRLTLINVFLTVFAPEPRWTVAGVVVCGVYTCPSVLARLVQAVIDVQLTDGALPARLTNALEAIDLVPAIYGVLARTCLALIHINLTVWPNIARLALAGILGHIVHTLATVLAQIFLTVIWVDLTVGSLKAFGTFACVGTNTLLAHPSILTGFMCALINVYLASDPSVAWMASAGEGVQRG